VATGRGTLGARDVGDGGHQLAEEFRRVVRMEDVGRAAAKMQFVEETRYEGSGLAIG
jgi:hypothetical protein